MRYIKERTINRSHCRGGWWFQRYEKRKKAQGNNHIDKNICAFFLVPVVPS